MYTKRTRVPSGDCVVVIVINGKAKCVTWSMPLVPFRRCLSGYAWCRLVIWPSAYHGWTDVLCGDHAGEMMFLLPSEPGDGRDYVLLDLNSVAVHDWVLDFLVLGKTNNEESMWTHIKWLILVVSYPSRLQAFSRATTEVTSSLGMRQRQPQPQPRQRVYGRGWGCITVGDPG